jgi:UDP-glucose 4-epimerase
VLNVSTGRETAVSDLAALLNLATEHRPGRAGEVQRSCLDPSAALHNLGWRAQVSLAEGLEQIR